MDDDLAQAVTAMIAERRRVRETNHRARQASTAGVRGVLRERRQAGLQSRHQTKLARNRAQATLV